MASKRCLGCPRLAASLRSHAARLLSPGAQTVRNKVFYKGCILALDLTVHVT